MQASSHLPRPGSPAAWLLATRPKTLPAAAAPVILATALAWAHGPVRWDLAAACFTVALVLQIAANLANDYFDAHSGVDQPDRLGPTRVTQTGLLRPGQVLGGLVACLVVAMAAGLFAASQAGWWLLWLGGACLLGTVAYTAGPVPLSRLGLGEPAALVFFGWVACTGSFVVIHGGLTHSAWAAGLIPGLHAAAIMAVNNLRDIRTDQRAGKRTLAVKLGETGARRLPAVLIVLGNLSAGLLIPLTGQMPLWFALLLVPLSWPLLRAYRRTPISPALNGVLARTGQWELLTCVVVAVALVLNGMV